jgi:translation initiation factor IF-1
MAREDAFRIEGVIIEALPNGTYRVELPNGHRLLGFLAGRQKATAEKPAGGQKVKLQLTPFDLTTGRILVESR